VFREPKRTRAPSLPREHPSTQKRRLRIAAAILVAAFVIVLLLPSTQTIPVQGATSSDWNHATFWHHPWGRSGVHKGIDIFASEETPVVASTGGVVVYSGSMTLGGNVVAVLGPKWRVHYYAHLATRSARVGQLLRRGDPLGTVGTTGNAAGKPPHLHYAVVTLVPYPWRISSAPQGWKKMIYLSPHELLIS
jgi:murein DD-endopeptidase MepM/ murein hydrolase activator NlpD